MSNTNIEVLILNDIIDREGSESHERRFSATMRNTFNASVQIVNNPVDENNQNLPFTPEFLQNTFNEHFTQPIIERCDKFVVALWSHGTSDAYLKSRGGRPINVINDVLLPLRRILAYKFIWLMVHMCRSFPTEDGPEKRRTRVILSFPTSEGQVAVRDGYQWTYIPILCDLLEEHGRNRGLKDILNMCKEQIKAIYPTDFPIQVPGYRTSFYEDFNLVTGLMPADNN